MKRKFFFIVIVLTIVLSGCGLISPKEPLMDELAEDGKYHYKNKALGFSIVLPSEFEYWQTQRIEAGDYIDIEIFVPTTDRMYSQELVSYAKFLVVRMFHPNAWDGLADKNIYQYMGQGNNRVYTLRFWDKIPVDWLEKWTNDMRQGIVDGFDIY